MGLFGSSKSDQSTTVSNSQTSFDSSANAAGAQTITASGKSRVDVDQRSGYVESKGNSSANVEGSDNLILGTGAAYTHVEQLGDEVVARSLDSVDSTTANAFQFGRDALAFADQSHVRTTASLQSAVTVADEAARRNAEFADASRLTLERIADPASSTSRTILYVVAGLAVLALFIFRPRKPKPSA